MQEIVNIEDLSLEQPTCKLDLQLLSGNLDFGKVPMILTEKSYSLCLNCANHVDYFEHLLSFQKSGVLVGWALSLACSSRIHKFVTG